MNEPQPYTFDRLINELSEMEDGVPGDTEILVHDTSHPPGSTTLLRIASVRGERNPGTGRYHVILDTTTSRIGTVAELARGDIIAAGQIEVEGADDEVDLLVEGTDLARNGVRRVKLWGLPDRVASGYFFLPDTKKLLLRRTMHDARFPDDERRDVNIRSSQPLPMNGTTPIVFYPPGHAYVPLHRWRAYTDEARRAVNQSMMTPNAEKNVHRVLDSFRDLLTSIEGGAVILNADRPDIATVEPLLSRAEAALALWWLGGPEDERKAEGVLRELKIDMHGEHDHHLTSLKEHLRSIAGVAKDGEA